MGNSNTAIPQAGVVLAQIMQANYTTSQGKWPFSNWGYRPDAKWNVTNMRTALANLAYGYIRI